MTHFMKCVFCISCSLDSSYNRFFKSTTRACLVSKRRAFQPSTYSNSDPCSVPRALGRYRPRPALALHLELHHLPSSAPITSGCSHCSASSTGATHYSAKPALT
eukprot:3570002-Amphidinium_carterae.1